MINDDLKLTLKQSLAGLESIKKNSKAIDEWHRVYYRGVFVTAVAVIQSQCNDSKLMSSFEQACEIVTDLLPDNCVDLALFIPESWFADFGIESTVAPVVNPNWSHMAVSQAAVDFTHGKIGAGELRRVVRHYNMY